MITLILVGIVLLFINFTIGCIYIAAILMAITIGLIIKEEKNKGNERITRTQRPKRTKEVNTSNKLKELYERDRKKFWVYFVCAIIVFITIIFCGVVIIEGVG